ncbi:hypothetical protein ACJX0J_018831, partial [Zea mays]
MGKRVIKKIHIKAVFFNISYLYNIKRIEKLQAHTQGLSVPEPYFVLFIGLMNSQDWRQFDQSIQSFKLLYGLQREKPNETLDSPMDVLDKNQIPCLIEIKATTSTSILCYTVFTVQKCLIEENLGCQYYILGKGL